MHWQRQIEEHAWPHTVMDTLPKYLAVSNRHYREKPTGSESGQRALWWLQLRGLLTWRQVNTGMEQLECVELNTPGSTESVIINFYQLSWYAYWWNSCAFNAVIQQSGDTFIHHQQTDGVPSFRFFQPLSYTAKLQTVTVEATVMCWNRLTRWIPDRHRSMETTCSVHCVC